MAPDKWENPPCAHVGEDNADKLYIGVGMVNSAWERLQAQLLSLYSLLSNHNDPTQSRKEFANFKLGDQQTAIKKLVSEYSRQYKVEFPNDEWKRIKRNLVNLMHRRHEVAHGQVTLGVFFNNVDSKPHEGYVVLPSLHSRNKHISGDIAPYTSYSYVAVHLAELASSIEALQAEVRKFQELLAAKFAKK